MTKMTPEEIYQDMVNSNLELVAFSINRAERINWGRHAHNGYKFLLTLKGLYEKCNSNSKNVDKEDLIEMCRTRQALCDIMWQVEHPCGYDPYAYAKPIEKPENKVI